MDYLKMFFDVVVRCIERNQSWGPEILLGLLTFGCGFVIWFAATYGDIDVTRINWTRRIRWPK